MRRGEATAANMSGRSDGASPEVGNAGVSGEGSGETPLLGQRRARRFSLSNARLGASLEANMSMSMIGEEIYEEKREREGVRGASEGGNSERWIGMGHLRPATEEWYFHRLSGCKDATAAQHTARDQRLPSLRSQEPLASVMTHRYLHSSSAFFAASSPLLVTGSPANRRAHRPLLRSLSAPFFHSWTYGNIDISHQVRLYPSPALPRVAPLRRAQKTTCHTSPPFHLPITCGTFSVPHFSALFFSQSNFFCVFTFTPFLSLSLPHFFSSVDTFFFLTG